MTAKEYLSRSHLAELRIDAKLEQYAQLRAIAQKTTATVDGMPHGGNGEHIDATYSKLLDLEDAIICDVANLVLLKAETAEAIKKVPDVRGRLVLEYRYLNYYDFDTIAAKMHYTRKWVTALHGRALQMVKVPEQFL